MALTSILSRESPPSPAGLYQMELASLTVADTAPPVIEARLPTSISSSLPALADAAHATPAKTVASVTRARMGAQHSSPSSQRQPDVGRGSLRAPFLVRRRFAW